MSTASVTENFVGASPLPENGTNFRSFDRAAALRDLAALHRPIAGRDSFPWLTWHWRCIGHRTLQSKSVPADHLAQIIDEVRKRPMVSQEDHWVAQNSFKHRTRRTLHLHACNALYADIDLCIDDPSASMIDRLTQRLLLDIDVAGIPRPSYIVWSGRGLHPKWVFSRPLSAAALPRWDACQKFLCDRLTQAGSGWPVDMQARDASRILRLVGTCNNKPGSNGMQRSRPVIVAWDAGQQHDFDVLAEHLLPYTRAEVQSFRAEACAAKTTWQAWDKNRAKAAGAIKALVHSAAGAASESAQSLHWHRLNALREIASARGGIAEGKRNEWVWVAANSLAWGVGSTTRLDLEMPHLILEIVPTFTPQEIRLSAGSVIRRLKESGRDGLYRLSNAAIAERLGLDANEAKKLALGGVGHVTHTPGAMNLPKMRGLSFDAWRDETKKRFALGGQYAAQVRSRHGRAPNEDLRAQARAMRAAGETLDTIAAALNCSRSTVSRWCQI